MYLARGRTLDYETDPVKYITVRATPLQQPEQGSEFRIPVYLIDVDEPPLFIEQMNFTQAIRTVPEDAAPGSAFPDAKLTAIDPEGKDEDTEYSIFSMDQDAEVGGPDGEPLFTIDPTDGTLHVGPAGGLSFERYSEYKLQVRATSKVNAAIFSQMAVTIRLEDRNDAPMFPEDIQEITARFSQLADMAWIGTDTIAVEDEDVNSTVFVQLLQSSTGVVHRNLPGPGSDITRKNYVGVDGGEPGNATAGRFYWTEAPNATADISWTDQIYDGQFVRLVYTVKVNATDNYGATTIGDVRIILVSDESGGTDRPLVESVTMPSGSALTTSGGQTLRFAGSRFSRATSFRVVGTNAIGRRYETTSCTATDDNTLDCAAPEGTGLCNWVVYAMVNGEEIRSFAIGRMEFGYQAPNITAVTMDQVAIDAGGLNTKGVGSSSTHELNSKFVITGTDLGSDPQAVMVYVGRVTPTSSEYRFVSTSIESADHDSLLVGAPEGIGADLQVRVSVGGQFA